jgi:hypothetical protein
MIYTIIRSILTTGFGLFAANMTMQFTKKTRGEEYAKTVGTKIAAAKIIAGLLIGLLWQIQIFPLLRGPIIALIVGSIGIGIVFNELTYKKSVYMLLAEFMIVGLVCELLGTYLLGIWF